MKLTIVLLTAGFLQVSAKSVSQSINFSGREVPLTKVFREVKKQTGVLFFYDRSVLEGTKRVTIKAFNVPLIDFLNEVFKDQPLKFTIQSKTVVISRNIPAASTINPEISSPSPPIDITGKVTDEEGRPLDGTSIKLKGTSKGAIADASGSFAIQVPDGGILMFSHIGYETVEMPVAKAAYLKIVLRPEKAKGEEEVVVVGYGTQKKLELTGAVASVKSGDFVKGSITDAAQLIKGQVAGVTIINPDANPTGTSQILLRGVTTLASGSQPLIVIDGIPGSLNDVAPEDIQSIDILKDGSAAAIYGTRGTNGVILITTKKINKETPATIDLNSYVTTQVVTKALQFMSADDYRGLVAQGRPGAIDYGASTNWIKEIFQTPVSQTHNVSIKSGNANTNYIININYKALEGLVLNSDNNILNSRIEANHAMFNGKVKINANITGYDQRNNAGTNAYRHALVFNPTDPIKNANGDWTEHPGTFNYANPISLIKETNGLDKSTKIKPFGSISILPVRGLTLKMVGSHDIYTRMSGYAESSNHINSILNARNGYASRSAERNVEDLIEITGNYVKSFKNHNTSLLGGYTYNKYMTENFSANNFNFPSDLYSYNNLSVGAARTAGLAGMSSYKATSTLISYFARANYNYKSKYLLAVSIRQEGSTKFGKDHKWGAFPAVSAGWNIISEPFMANIPAISAFKLRGGYGITGTAPSTSYRSLSRLSYSNQFQYNGTWIPVIYPSTNDNPDLKWEKKGELNLGLELGAFSNRLFASVDFYKRTTKDLLWDYSVASPPYLYNSIFANGGTMENKGIEVQINATPVQTSTFRWNASLNYSSNKNKLISLSNDKYQLKSGFFYAGMTGEPLQTNTHRVEEGEAIGNFWGLKSVDIDTDGRWIIEDAAGKPKPIASQQPEDKKILGNGLPKHYVNLNNSISYKQFDLGVTMRGAFGYQILNFTRMFYSSPIKLGGSNVMKGTYDNIYGKRPLNDLQELQYVSYYLEDGDYWKIDNITLGYTVNIKKGPIKYLRLYASGSNMFTFTNYTGIDPEVNAAGLAPGNDDRDRYPSTRAYTFGFLMSLK